MERKAKKKKNIAIEEGAEMVGYVFKKNDTYQVIANGRERNLTEEEYRKLMLYSD
jgi:phosphotransferase system IIB component